MPKVLLTGADGTLGRRFYKILQSLNYEILPVINSGGKKFDRQGDQIVFKEDALVVEGSNLEERLKRARKNGIGVSGVLDENFSFTDIDYIVDMANSEGTRYNLNNIYPLESSLIVQGGTQIVSEDKINPYLSAPGCRNVGKRVKQVSCNTTWLSTALGLVASVEKVKEINSVYAQLLRRFADPEEVNKEFDGKQELTLAPKYSTDVRGVLMKSLGQIEVSANKNSWRHFHKGKITVYFNTSFDYEATVNEFREYGRCIVWNEDEGMNKVMEASSKIGIPDGDLLLPIFYLRKVNVRKLEISGYNPQRGITLPSTLDWLQGDVFNDFEWYGMSLAEQKKKMEDLL